LVFIGVELKQQRGARRWSRERPSARTSLPPKIRRFSEGRQQGKMVSLSRRGNESRDA
jgi:hypothetical protein